MPSAASVALALAGASWCRATSRNFSSSLRLGIGNLLQLSTKPSSQSSKPNPRFKTTLTSGTFRLYCCQELALTAIYDGIGALSLLYRDFKTDYLWMIQSK